MRHSKYELQKTLDPFQTYIMASTKNHNYFNVDVNFHVLFVVAVVTLSESKEIKVESNRLYCQASQAITLLKTPSYLSKTALKIQFSETDEPQNINSN